MAEYDLTKITNETRRRMAQAEELLCEPGMTTKKARRLLAVEWGISNRQAGRVLEKVHQQWRIEAQADRERKRDHMRHRLQYAQRKALTRKAALFNPADGCVEYYESPDAGASIRAMELECRLDGLLEQDGAPTVLINNGEINFDQKVLQAMQQVYGLAPESETLEEKADD